MATGKKSDSIKITAAERRQQVLNLRRGGGSYRSIAAQLKISAEQVRRDLKHSLSALAEQELELTGELRALEADRLDALTLAYWQKGLGGDLDAANFILKVIDKRSKLYGLDASIKIENTGDAGEGWAAIRGVIFEALAAFPEAKLLVAAKLQGLGATEKQAEQADPAGVEVIDA